MRIIATPLNPQPPPLPLPFFFLPRPYAYRDVCRARTTRRPTKGTALLFFPAAGGIPGAPFDVRTLHCGEAVAEDAVNEKWIAQVNVFGLQMSFASSSGICIL